MRAVSEVRDGAPVVEVAERTGTSRQTVTTWRKPYETTGLDGTVAATAREPEAHSTGSRGLDLRDAAPPPTVGRATHHLRTAAGDRRSRTVPLDEPSGSWCAKHWSIRKNSNINEPTNGGRGRLGTSVAARPRRRDIPRRPPRMQMLTGIDDHFGYYCRGAREALRHGPARGLYRHDEPVGCAVRGPYRQRRAVHRQVHPPIAGGGALRTHLPRRGHHSPFDQTTLIRPSPTISNISTEHSAANSSTRQAHSPPSKLPKPRSKHGSMPTTPTAPDNSPGKPFPGTPRRRPCHRRPVQQPGPFADDSTHAGPAQPVPETLERATGAIELDARVPAMVAGVCTGDR